MPAFARLFVVRLSLAFLLLLACGDAFAVQVSQKNICANARAGRMGGRECILGTQVSGSPATPQANVWTLNQYANLPVGTSLTMCSAISPVPPGWFQTGFHSNPSVCGAQYGQPDSPYNTVTISYVDCTHESSILCYPSLPQFGVIAALPTSVPVPYGQSDASTTLGWFASTSSACVWVTTEGASTQLWTCDGKSGSQTWPYASAGVTQTFVLSPSSTAATPVLSSVSVKGVEGSAPHIHASPRSVAVPAGQAQGSTTISYDLIGSDYDGMCIWVSNNDAPPQLWACGSGFTFAQAWPYVPKGGKSVFWLNPSRTSSSQILATVTVTGH